MKTYIKILLCLNILTSSFQALASNQTQLSDSKLNEIIDAKVITARSLGEQVKILDIRKLATERFIQNKNSTILKNSMEKALKSIGGFLACSILCTSVAAVVIPPILIVGVGVSNMVESKIASFLTKSVTFLAAGSVTIAYAVGPFVAAYMGYKAVDSSAWSMQISKFEGMTEAQVMTEYESILSQGQTLIGQIKAL